MGLASKSINTVKISKLKPSTANPPQTIYKRSSHGIIPNMYCPIQPLYQVISLLMTLMKNLLKLELTYQVVELLHLHWSLPSFSSPTNTMQFFNISEWKGEHFLWWYDCYTLWFRGIRERNEGATTIRCGTEFVPSALLHPILRG